MTDIGTKIKQRRLELGMSQDELAEKMGYKSRSTIAKIENGTNDVVQGTIVKFSQVLNTSIAYLMGWDEEEIEAVDAAHQESLVSTNQVRFKEEFGDTLFTDDEIEKIIDYIRFVLNSRK